MTSERSQIQGRGRGRGRGQGQRNRQQNPESETRVNDGIVRGRGRGRGSLRSSSGRSRNGRQAQAAAVAENEIGESSEMNVARSIPQHQLMLPTRPQGIVPASEAIVPTSRATVPAPAPAPARDSAALESILNNVVAKTLCYQYNTKAVGFVLRCYKNHRSLLKSELAI